MGAVGGQLLWSGGFGPTTDSGNVAAGAFGPNFCQ